MRTHLVLLLTFIIGCEVKKEVPRHEYKILTAEREADSEPTAWDGKCELRLGFHIDFQPGKRPKLAFLLYENDASPVTYTPEIHSQRALRAFEGETLKISFREERWAMMRSGPGRYRIEALVDGEKKAEVDVSFPSGTTPDICPKFAETSLHIPATETLVKDERFDYYPLHSGEIIAVDKSQGTAFSLDGKAFVDVEIVRVLQEIDEGNEMGMNLLESISWWVPEVKLEREVGTGKLEIGRFHETGLYRGEISDTKFEDTLNRALFARPVQAVP